MIDSLGKYPVALINGQRIFFPAANAGIKVKTPPKGSEVFVGNLPRDLYEDELVPLFSDIGPIYKLRLMMDFTGKTRGFGFVQFHSLEDADSAVELLNNYVFWRKDGRCAVLTVHPSLDNRRLFFGNVPRDLTPEEIQNDLTRTLDGVVKVFTFAENIYSHLNRGFVFAEFETHAMAAVARRKLLTTGMVELWGSQRIYVDWAEPEPQVSRDVLKQVCILHLSNLPNYLSVNRFKSLIIRLLGSIKTKRIYKKYNYAFIHFYNHYEAEEALKIIRSASDRLAFGGCPVEVNWARPVCFSKQFTHAQPPNNFCTSVPPDLRRMVIWNKLNKLGKPNNFEQERSLRNNLFAEINVNDISDFQKDDLAFCFQFQRKFL